MSDFLPPTPPGPPGPWHAPAQPPPPTAAPQHESGATIGATRGRVTLHWAWLVLGAFLVFVVGVGMGAAGKQADEAGLTAAATSTAQPQEQPATTQEVETTTTSAPTTTAAPTTTQPPPPPQWQTIFTLSGTGMTKTAPFTIPSEARGGKAKLVYTFTGYFNDVVRLVPVGDRVGFGDLLVNEIGPVSGETYIYATGTYYLDITGETWTVAVQVLQ